MPSCVRLLDNEHFRLGQALRPEATSMLEELQAAASKMLLLATLSMNYSSESVVCATINYEGSQKEVRHQISAVRRLAQTHEGVVLGPKVGKAGYELTFMIAYLRDFAVTYHILGESFETFCPWSRIESLVAATKKRIVTEHSSRLLPGLPFVGCRVTQLYHEGVCLYFYLCMSFDGIGRCGTDSPSEVFADLELAARDEILKQGGSLSHHHGVGKLKARFLNQRVSHEFECVVRSIKDSVDKNNIFGARNGVFCDNKSAVDVMYRKNS
jgi:alkyldihydroxyacetonephosphate synthase